MQPLASDVIEVVLEPTDEPLLYQAGQYVEWLYPDGNFYPFSIANAPDPEGVLEFHVRLRPDDLPLAAMLLALEQTGEMQFQGPLGQCVLPGYSDQECILLAGGTGVAPMKAMMEAADEVHRLHLFWGVSQPEQLYLHEVFLGACQDGKLQSYTPVVSGHQPWRGKNGWVHEVVIEQFSDLSDKRVYVSGPFELVHAARALYSHYGLADEHFLTDIL